MSKRLSDQEFVALFHKYKGISPMARAMGMDAPSLHQRRRRLEKKGIFLNSYDVRSPTFTRREHSPRVDLDLPNGVLMVASDAHYLPNVESTAHRAFCAVAKKIKPFAFVMNGDLLDGGAISRFPRSSWEKAPSIKEEIEAVQNRLEEIQNASPRSKRWWTMGNHDMRFETKLANQVPEFEGVLGFALKDHFPQWNFTISLMVNNNLMIKHRFNNGVHATYNNTLRSAIITLQPEPLPG